MSRRPEDDLIGAIIAWVKDNKLANGTFQREITPDTDLLATGLLDSLGFVNLVLFLEEQVGHKIELADAQPEEFCVVSGLSRLATRSCPELHV